MEVYIPVPNFIRGLLAIENYIVNLPSRIVIPIIDYVMSNVSVPLYGWKNNKTIFGKNSPTIKHISVDASELADRENALPSKENFIRMFDIPVFFRTQIQERGYNSIINSAKKRFSDDTDPKFVLFAYDIEDEEELNRKNKDLSKMKCYDYLDIRNKYLCIHLVALPDDILVNELYRSVYPASRLFMYVSVPTLDRVYELLTKFIKAETYTEIEDFEIELHDL